MIAPQITSLVDNTKKILGSNSVAIDRAWGILQSVSSLIIQNIEANNPNLKGADKKSIAMTVISNFYDQVFTVVDFPFAPKFLQPIIQKYVKQLLMLLVSASIDALVITFRESGIFEDPSKKVDLTIDQYPKISDK